ncbi:E3 SUMO-protein ligase ZBED1-like [Panonychus citri]|uniref:E3 SUMO-protein ligase ZBED1-like n=1 Tax=Panonychus citri TaxID=50023 RepID=UPI002307232D|nr:E3 SUMO-protein ligase ZBED1-like [Panonychus citri]
MDDESYFDLEGFNFYGANRYSFQSIENVPGDIRFKEKSKFGPKLSMWIAIGQRGLCSSSILTGGDKKTQVDNAIVWFIVKGLKPFSVVDEPAFVQLLKSCCKHVSVPSRKTITNLTMQIYQRKKDLVSTHLQTIDWLLFTFVVWTDTYNSRSYLGLTCHYIDSYCAKSLCLKVIALTEAHSANYIATTVKDIMQEYNIDQEKLVTMVTDGATNIVSAAKLITSHPLWCIAHRINLIVIDSIKKTPWWRNFWTAWVQL